MEPPKRLPMARRGIGSKGQSTELLANHFRVRMSNNNDYYFYHYDVAMSYEDGKLMEAKVLGRKVIDQVYKIYPEMKNVSFAYDGEKGLFTLGPLPKKSNEYTVVIEDISSRSLVLQLCDLVPLQRYTKALTVLQRSKLVENTRQKPRDRKSALQDSLRSCSYGDEPMLRSSGIVIDPNFTKIQGRVLQPPQLTVGREVNILPERGRWNFNNKKLFSPVTIDRWSIVNFSHVFNKGDMLGLIEKCYQDKGMKLAPPYNRLIIEEDDHCRREPPNVRVEKMFAKLKSKLPPNKDPEFLLCILPEKKNCDIYGPWKRKCLVDEGIATQCISPPARINDQYITNVLLKINAKFGGMNSKLSIELAHSIPKVSQVPTLILGMDVSHGAPGRADVPSIAAVVSSRYWPQVSRYRATVRTQSSKVEMIQALFQPVPGSASNEDNGIIREVVMDFLNTGNVEPHHIIIFRDGVSESQFKQVLNIELSEIIEACKYHDEKWDPKFTVIVAQKNHHTRFFQQKGNFVDNVPSGTVVDTTICDTKNNDFYLCAHHGMIGTTRPVHYHVLHDDIGFTADELQELTHSLSYTYQRSTTAVSLVAPICYAHLAAAQMAQFVKFDEPSDTSGSNVGVTQDAAPPVASLPRLHEQVINTMFFC